jgi:hypothetical protein
MPHKTKVLIKDSKEGAWCPICKKFVEGKLHVRQYHNAAGNPMSPADKTIGNKFWSGKV